MTAERSAIHWNPLRLDGTKLPETLLLAARLLAVVIAVSGYWPFVRGVVMIDVLAELGSAERFTGVLRLCAAAGVAALVFTRWVRIGAALIGGSILLGLLGALGAYSVAHNYVAAFFLVVSLSSRRVGSELLRLQLVVLYSGSALHKSLDFAWWNGDYFHTFLVVRHEIMWLDYPGALIALGIGTIVAEWSLALLFARAQTREVAARLGVVFHASITLTSGLSFGPFLTALFLSFLAVGREGRDAEPPLLRPAVLLLATLLISEPHIRQWTTVPTVAFIALAVAIPSSLLPARLGSLITGKETRSAEPRHGPRET